MTCFCYFLHFLNILWLTLTEKVVLASKKLFQPMNGMWSTRCTVGQIEKFCATNIYWYRALQIYHLITFYHTHFIRSSLFWHLWAYLIWTIYSVKNWPSNKVCCLAEYEESQRNTNIDLWIYQFGNYILPSLTWPN